MSGKNGMKKYRKGTPLTIQHQSVRLARKNQAEHSRVQPERGSEQRKYRRASKHGLTGTCILTWTFLTGSLLRVRVQ